MTWTLTNADCIAAMQSMPDKAYDLAIVDPPYGIGADRCHTEGHGWTMRPKPGWDNATPPQLYFEELMRVSKNQIIWGGNYFSCGLPNSMGWVVWDKGQREFSLADAELAYTSFDRAIRVFELSRAHSLLDAKSTGGRLHPTQKPVALYKWLLKNYAKPNDRILDTHGGSCSSVIAAIDMGFSIDAYELDPDYYAMALKRIQMHELQPRLIPNTPPTTEQTTLL